jgi:hypothetical protein
MCPPHQFSQYGYCVDSSPFCGTFDPIMGNCLTCIENYYLQSDGTCLQGLPTSDSLQSLQVNPCPAGYYYSNFSCLQPSPLCKNFNIYTGACTSCKNETYFLNSVGTCILISDYCGFRKYFNNGNCL